MTITNKQIRHLDEADNLEYNYKEIANPTEETNLYLVELDGFNIQWIKNPSEEVQLMAVQESVYSEDRDGFDSPIHFIKNPSKAVQMEAVKTHIWNVEFIDFVDEEVQEYIVKQMLINKMLLNSPCNHDLIKKITEPHLKKEIKEALK